MYIDIQVKVWQRYHLPDGATLEDAMKITENPGDFDGDWETLLETEEYLDPTPEGSTVQIFEDAPDGTANDCADKLLWENKSASKGNLFILHLLGCVSPEVHGPYETEEERTQAALEIYNSANFSPDADQLLRIDGNCTVSAFAAYELEIDIN